MSLAKIQAPPLTQNVADVKGDAKKAADAKKVGQDFEAILVRQLLAQTNLGGKGGYADMATEALATAVTKGGGLGLGKVIEQHLLPHTVSEAAPKAKGAAAHPSAAVSAFKKLAEPAKPASGTVFSIQEK